jgi:hypothetical protein
MTGILAAACGKVSDGKLAVTASRDAAAHIPPYQTKST